MDAELHPIETLSRLFDAETVAAFQNAFGGLVLGIPMTIGVEHPISQAIGVEKAQALAGECGGARFHINKVPFTQRVAALVAQGLKTREIARALMVTERHVYKTRRKLREAQPNQCNGASAK